MLVPRASGLTIPPTNPWLLDDGVFPLQGEKHVELVSIPYMVELIQTGVTQDQRIQCSPILWISTQHRWISSHRAYSGFLNIPPESLRRRRMLQHLDSSLPIASKEREPAVY